MVEAVSSVAATAQHRVVSLPSCIEGNCLQPAGKVIDLLGRRCLPLVNHEQQVATAQLYKKHNQSGELV